MPSAELRVEVACYAGHKGEETPRRLDFGGRTVEVVEVLDSWLGPDHAYFKVLGADGARYILRHDTASGHWEMIMFERSRSP
ncbi:MAG: hypothetical protein HY521_06580 [Proteobacteria bacterium]|nr:hypothetical protein [Pseudomonadota bacterium]